MTLQSKPSGLLASAVLMIVVSSMADAPRASADPQATENSGLAAGSLVVGKPAPKFWTFNASGQFATLEDPFVRDRWVLLEFWSALDKDRAKAEEQLTALRNQFLHEDRLLILSVCVDLQFEDWLEHVDSKPDLPAMNGAQVEFYSDSRWWQLLLGANREADRREVLEHYQLEKTPQYFLIQPGHTLALKNIPRDKLQQVISKHLPPPHKARLRSPAMT